MNNVVTIVAITLFSYWLIGVIIFIATKQNEAIGTIWGMGLVFVLAYVLCYPIRAMNSYSVSKEHYKRLGISRLQYFFGKRPKTRGR